MDSGYYLLAGQQAFKESVGRLVKKGRFPNSIIITGSKGSGKKAAAAFMAATLLCEREGVVPCGECASCKMVKKGAHPDFLSVSPSGKSGAYLLESDLRPIISEAYIKPNQSAYKIILIADIDNSRIETQNVLLKLVEEPPEYLVIIMTAKTREAFLKTILSRVTPFSLEETKIEDTRAAVKEIVGEKYSDEDFKKAYEAFGGNVGRCADYLTDGSLKSSCETARAVADAVARRDEYALLKALNSVVGKKESASYVIELLSEVFRDAAVVRSKGEAKLVSSCKSEAQQLGKKLSAAKSLALYRLCGDYLARLAGNANLTLLLNSLCAEIMDTV